MRLKECLMLIDNYLTENQKIEIKKLEKNELVHYIGLLMRIRNDCNLWKHGTQEVENDIHFLMNNGYYIDYVMELLGEKMALEYNEVNYDLNHPGNCSLAILDAYQDYLLEKLPINLLK